jgi:ATP-binding cassette subfamily B multidrug efflux pump
MGKNKTTKGIILGVIKKKPVYLVALILMVISVVVFSLLPPQILKIIIDDYLLGTSTGLAKMGVIYLITFLLIGVFDFIKGFMLTVVGQKIIKEIRFAMKEKMGKIKAAYFTHNGTGQVSSIFINDVDNINTLFTDGVISMAIDLFKIIGIIISIWFFNYKLGIFALCLIPIVALITSIFRKKMFHSQTRNLLEVGKVNNHIGETIRNMIMIKTFNKEAYMEGRYKEYLEDNYKTMDRVNFYDSCFSPVIQMMTAISIATVFYFASEGDNYLGISIGMVAAATNLITNLFAPIDSLGMELSSIQKGLSGVESVDDFLAAEEDVFKDQLATEELNHLGKGEMVFKDVHFSYDDGPEILKGLNLVINPGEKISFVGRTGAGKSTLFKLMVGLLVPTKGEITYNGIPVWRILNSEKRRLFGYVEQNFSFVKASVLEQITLFDEAISYSQVESVLDFVGLLEYCKGLDNGLLTEADKKLFSEGQKQLLAIARALVTNPPILFLDEVTANLDAVTEDKVVKVLKEAGEGKTILSIAHRTSTIYSSDKVIEVKDGMFYNII